MKILQKKILAIVGMPGAGKGTCTDYLHADHGLPVIHFGNMVYEEVERRGLDNVKDEIFVREDMRATEGPAVLAKHVARKIQKHFDKDETRVVLDGLYSWTEYKYLHSLFGSDLVVLAIAAPKHIRHQRVLNRKDSHRKYTLNQLVTREIAEIENLEKGGPIANADYTIVNEEDPYVLIERLEQILTQTKFL
ncbi:AAA family ATPase [Candidatus Saccharibacteria bacterium]|nr:AAA family ATPase [Candidatus Saccharibacteria bacterium]